MGDLLGDDYSGWLTKEKKSKDRHNGIDNLLVWLYNGMGWHTTGETLGDIFRQWHTHEGWHARRRVISHSIL